MIGIDKINFFTPSTYIDLVTLAKHRGIDPDKFTIGIGQTKMAVPTITQDTVSMGANAAFPILDKEDLTTIDLIVVGTETGIDESKSAASFIHQLLNIHPFAKAVEIKQACYGATAGLMMAQDFIKAHPGRKALVIGSDISRYGLNTSGEVTQGAGAIAMLVSENPRILALEDTSVAMTESIFDFWRPNYSDTAIVDGKFSNEAYINFFKTIWEEFSKRTNLTFEDFKAICFHLPYTKMGKKALLPLLENESEEIQELIMHHYNLSTTYTRDIGNIYTGSLYLSLMSLLDSDAHSLQSGDLIGLFSYGSGAVGEFFYGRLVEGFENHLLKEEHETLLNNRYDLSMDEYEAIFNKVLPKEDGTHPLSEAKFDNSLFYLSSITDHKRQYSKRQ
ncbi:hydroxymethylglutaryl-CoA synthase [Vagococcus hydrophili]|uniref:Hydroxymethylglutaryl-CoA synthase n=1 Tax=Vagococcus hydrophili TaxID=2714947 RepID=A0A6G8AVG1_9ENTE|nr:hydroxymethylglutaryl-CoA synthase [Vagococcus hydrophili]QIL48925.1 hydroxymethylglutaryl-CoA synthase [Vagococcus hydrophili]